MTANSKTPSPFKARSRETSPGRCACVYALHGQTDEALDCLERAVKSGLGQKDWIEQDWDLNSVRNHPRFEALLARL